MPSPGRATRDEATRLERGYGYGHWSGGEGYGRAIGAGGEGGSEVAGRGWEEAGGEDTEREGSRKGIGITTERIADRSWTPIAVASGEVVNGRRLAT